MSHNETTICALASSTGQGGIGIVRVSGARCIEIAKKMLNIGVEINIIRKATGLSEKEINQLEA